MGSGRLVLVWGVVDSGGAGSFDALWLGFAQELLNVPWHRSGCRGGVGVRICQHGEIVHDQAEAHCPRLVAEERRCVWETELEVSMGGQVLEKPLLAECARP